MIERILYNADIITLNRAQPRASALAIQHGRIVAIGTDDDILALARPHTIRQNLGRRVMIPGLTDAHIHWEWTARGLQQVNVFEVATKQQARDRVAERASKTPTGAWITGHGWVQDLWADRAFPTAADLDAVAPQHPVYLRAKSGHAAWVNTAALRACGVTASTSDPEGGQILRDSQTGEPTGILLEEAMGLVSRHIPPPSPDQLADMLLHAQNLALASGLTGLHDFDNPSCLAALQILRERGQLSLRVLKQINKAWLEDALRSGIRFGFGDDWLRFGALKLFADGALGPRTAAMLQPYEGEPDNYGIVVTPKEEMIDLALRASRGGLPTTIHAIGDRAVHDVLDTFEIVRRDEAERSVSRAAMRHRIEHVQLIHPDDTDRLATLNLIASMQPIHATSDYVMSDRYWGARGQWAYNARLQIDQGVVTAFGSDAPIEPFEPFKGIHAAVTRQRADGTPQGGWYPELRLSVDEALHGFTTGAAYAAGMEDRLGMLKVGYYADLVVLDRDPYTTPPEQLLHTQVIATMLEGAWRYGEV
jgi:predicted amidohydrolase YtcJ